MGTTHWSESLKSVERNELIIRNYIKMNHAKGVRNDRFFGTY